MKFFNKAAIVPAAAILFSCLLFLIPSVWAQNQTLIFSVTGDIPYSSSEAVEMQQQIADHNLYSPSEFLVHIGDIKAGSGSCSESVYQNVRNYLLRMQVPTFITPGDNEWIDCSNPPQAWNFWVQYFMNFEQNFCPVPGFQKQSVRPENFAWVQKGVLLIGISMPGGSEGSAKAKRLQDDADWVAQQFQAHGSQVRAAVIFAHNMDKSADALFINQFTSAANSFGKPILYIHGSGHSWIHDFPLSASNVLRVQVDNGGAALPVQVTVTTANPAAFVFNRTPWNSNSQPINRPPCGQSSAPAITVNPSSHDYGQVTVGSNSSHTFVVSNAGNANLQVTNTTLTGGNVSEFSLISGAGSYILSPGQTRDVVVRFNPASQGEKNTTLRFTSNDPDNGTQDVSLTGTGTSNVPQFTLTMNTLGAGSVDLNPSGGTYDANTEVELTANPAAGFQFSGWSGDLTGSNNPAMITMDANKNVTATFTPTDPGSAIVHEETKTGGSTGSNSVATSSSLISVSGHLYLASISNRSNASVTSVSGLGLTWTRVKAQCSTNGRIGLEVWMAQGTPSSNGVVTATFSSTPSNAAISVSRYSGVKASNPVGNLISGNLNGVNGSCSSGSESNAYSLNLTTTTNGAMVYGAIGMRERTHTPGAGYTERADLMQGSGSNAASVAVEDKISAAGTATVNGSFSGVVYWAVVALEIKPQTAGGATMYTLTANTSGSGSVALNPPGGVYETGTNVTLTATPAAGFQFGGWSGNLSGSTNPATITMDDNKTVTATFTALPPTQYSLTVNTSGSGSVALNPSGGTYNTGTSVTLTATPAAGFQFSGWSGDLSGSTNPAAITMNGNKTVTATFTALPPTQYSLTVNTVGSGSVELNPSGGTYNAGTNVTLTATPAAGYQFSGWSGDLTGSDNPATITMNANKNVTAIFTSNAPVDPIVHQETQTGGSTSSTTVTTSAALSGVSGHFYLATISNRSNASVASVSGLGLTWTRVKAQCSTNGRIGLEVWMAQGTPSSNGAVAATFSSMPSNAAIAVSRYSGVNTSNPIGNLISGNLNGVNGTCSSGSESNAYSFNLTTTTNGALVYGAIGMRERTHTPGAGYTERADRMQGSGSSAASVAVEDKISASAGTTIVNGSFSGVVYWTVIALEIKARPAGSSPQYTLTANTSGSGSVALNPPGGTYDAGTNVTLTATPATGFQFSGWTGDLNDATNPATITMDGNKAVTATFTALPPNQYSLTVNTSGSGSVTLNPSGGTYNAGTSVTLTATPAAGFQFSSWSGDLSGSTNPAAITMDANKNVTASFAPLGGGGQIVYQETQTGSSSSSTTVTTAASLTGINGDLYLAAIASRSRRAVTSVSGLGLNWTLVKAQCSGRNLTGVEIWMAQGIPQGGSNGTVTATFASAPSNAVIAVSRYSGAAAVNPIGNIVSGNTTGVNGACSGGSDNAAYSFNLTTTINGAIVYGAAAIRSTTHTPGAGYTERIEIEQGSSSPATVAVQEKSVASAGTVVFNGTFGGSNDWAVAAVEIKPQ